MIKLLATILLAITFAHAKIVFETGPVNFGDKVKPDASAVVQITSGTKGFLGPRMGDASRDAIATPAVGLEIFNTDSNEKQIYDGVQWSSIGTGNAFFRVTEVAHGRAIGKTSIPVYMSGGSWTDAKADAQASLATHVIVEVIDVDTFVVASSGRYNVPGHGLAIETHFYVSEVVAGDLTTDEPDVYSNPIVFAEDASTIHVMPYRAASLSAAGSGTVTSVYGRGGDVLAQAGDYSANLVTNTPAGNISSTDVQTALNELDTEKVQTGATINALASYNSNGLMTQTAPSTFTGRTIVAGSSKLTVSNGDGVAGNPTLDIDESQININNLAGAGAGYIDWTDATADFKTTGLMEARGNLDVSGDIGVDGLVDGRNISVDGTKLDGIEAGADITDAANVQAAGAVMNSFFAGAGILSTDGVGTYFNRSLTPGSTKITINNPNGEFGNPTFDVVENQIDVTNLLNYSANNNVDHSTVGIDVSVVEDGLLGGGDMTALRTLRVDINGQAVKSAPLANNDEFFLWDPTFNTLHKTTVADIVAAVPVTGEANTASNLGAGAQLFSGKVVADLEFRSLVSSPRVLLTQNVNDVSIDIDQSQIDITQLLGYDSDRYVDHTTVSITGGQGLSGGGNLSANSTIDMDLPSLVAETTIAANDLVVIYDTSAATERKMTRADFLTGVVTAPVDSVFGRTGVVVAAASDYDAVQVDNTPAGTIAATDVQGAINELDGDIQDLTTDVGNIGAQVVINTSDIADLSSDLAAISVPDSRADLNQGGILDLWDTSTDIPLLGTNTLIDLKNTEVIDGNFYSFNAGTDEVTFLQDGRYRVMFNTSPIRPIGTGYEWNYCFVDLFEGAVFAEIPRSRGHGNTRASRHTTMAVSFTQVFSTNDRVRIVCWSSGTNTQMEYTNLLIEYMGP